MGKKGKLYLLILVNLLAWGYVGYKVYGALQGDDETDFAMNNTSVKKVDATLKEEATQLVLNYPDPFLKGGNFSDHKTHSSHVSNQPRSAPPVIKQPVKPVSTPTVTPAIEIKYLGLIKNNTSGLQTALLSVNGRSVFVKLNDIVEGYLVKEMTALHILVVKGKEKLTISK